MVIYVVVDEPNADRQDNSAYPQYIAQGILSELLPYLDVAPDEAADGEVPQTELWEGFNGHLKDNELTGLGSIVIRYDENGIEDPEGEYDKDGNYIGPVTDTDSEDEEENTAGEEDTGEEEQGGDEDSDGTSQVDVSDDSTADGISDENVPGPLEDDSDPIEGNNAESDGVTNEEAGLE